MTFTPKRAAVLTAKHTTEPFTAVVEFLDGYSKRYHYVCDLDVKRGDHVVVAGRTGYKVVRVVDLIPLTGKSTVPIIGYADAAGTRERLDRWEEKRERDKARKEILDEAADRHVERLLREAAAAGDASAAALVARLNDLDY